MKRIMTLFAICLMALTAQAQLNVTYISDLSYTQDLNDIWGYVAPDGTEYALVGAANGTSIVSLADPANPVEVAYIPGDNSVWRDIKTWGEFAFVTTDSGNDGLTVIDLSNLPMSATSTNITSIAGLGTLTTCHNIYIDEFGYAYLAGCNLNNGGMLIFDCFTDTANPEFVVAAPNQYSHDVYVLANQMYSSEINIGVFTIYDVSDKDNITTLGSQTTPFAFTHNTWLSKDSTVLFTTDETANAPIGAYDITDPTDIEFLDSYAPFLTLGDGVIPHNVHVWEDWLIVSYYTDGCIIIDVSNPDNMIEVGNFDTYIPANTGFNGVWGAYPYLPSGLVLCTDIGNGLFVLEPNYVYGCYLEGDVTDASNGDAISAATITIENTVTFANTDATGEYKTGIATSDSYDVTASRPGFQSQTQTLSLENGLTTIANFELEPLPSFAISGQVVQANNGAPIEAAVINISDDQGFFVYDLVSDASGNFNIPSFFEGEYNISAGIWGFKTNLSEDAMIDMSNASLTIELEQGYEDIFSLDLGWTVTGENWTGDWVRAVSIPQIVGGGISLTPFEDLPEDQGNACYVTANGTDLFPNVLINGNTILTSPIFDLSTYNKPMLSFHQWYLSLDASSYGYPPPSDDIFIVSLSNGTESVIISQTEFDGDLYGLDWLFSGEVDIADLITPTDSMTISFEANAALGFDIITEAGVDFFQAWDAEPTSVDDLSDTNIRINAFPNPTADVFTLAYDLSEVKGDAIATVVNIIGQTVTTIALDKTTNKVRFGSDLSPGIYLIHIESGDQSSKSIKLVKQ